MSYSDKYKYLEENHPSMLNGLQESIVKEKIALFFPNIFLDATRKIKFEKALELIEFKAIELWSSNSEDFSKYCSNYLDIAMLLPVPENSKDKTIWVLKLIAFGYIGEDWQKVREFLTRNEETLIHKKFSSNWNLRLLEKIYQSIFYLVRKKNWKDLEHASNIINGLRLEQTEFEERLLSGILEKEEKKAVAIDLASLYHLSKATDLMAQFQREGKPNDIIEQIGLHFDYAIRYTETSNNIELGLLLQYINPFFKKMVSNSIWTMAKGINARVTRFKESITQVENNPIFELLYPQKRSLEQDYLFKKSVVVSLPTSSGKTLIAEFRMLQALNQFSDDRGWVVYAVPTRALVNQIHIRLQRDLSIGNLQLKIEKMSGALEIDSFEESIIQDADFDILITTYEKLSLLVRQDIELKLNRKLALVVIDEAHNIESEGRGLGLELLLANLKNQDANFLLLTPEIPKSEATEIAKWLNENHSTINIGLDWQPNDRIIGEIYAESEAKTHNAKTFFQPRITSKSTIQINEKILIKEYINNCPFTPSKLNNPALSALVAKDYNCEEGILIVVGQPRYTIPTAMRLFNMVDDNKSELKPELRAELELVQRFVASEMGEKFQLVELLNKRIGIHSSALPDDIRFLIENLMELGALKYLVCTTTIAQGINFPVSAIFMSTYKYSNDHKTFDMPTKDFWNLVGRAGRIGQKSLGTVGIAVANENDRRELSEYLQKSTLDLISVLKKTVEDTIDTFGDIDFYKLLHSRPEWSNFLKYISHLLKQSINLEEFINSVEITLRKTYGYQKLSTEKQRMLSDKVKEYAISISKRPDLISLADNTDFSTYSIYNIISELKNEQINRSSFSARDLFSGQNDTLQKLVGIMLNSPEIKNQIEGIVKTKNVLDKSTFAKIIADWVSGKSIDQIAETYYSGNISDCSRGIYSKLVNSATWGLSAMQQVALATSDGKELTEDEIRQYSNLPSMIYYGVNTEHAVALRKVNVPRSIATNLGNKLEIDFGKEALKQKSVHINNWLNKLSKENWNDAVPSVKHLSGEDYKMIWKKLNGII